MLPSTDALPILYILTFLAVVSYSLFADLADETKEICITPVHYRFFKSEIAPSGKDLIIFSEKDPVSS